MILSLAITACFSGVLKTLFFDFTNALTSYPTPSPELNFLLFFVLVMLVITVIHESIHGLCYTIFGGKVKFGFKGIYAYTCEISGKAIPAAKFTTVLLSPLILISLFCLLCDYRLGGMIFYINLLGSTGDLWMAATVLKHGRKAMIVDRNDGFDIIP